VAQQTGFGDGTNRSPLTSYLISSSVQAGGSAQASENQAIRSHYNGRLRFG
jgi:FKBP-type peptidyl-prolyl cis-trans isomerase